MSVDAADNGVITTGELSRAVAVIRSDIKEVREEVKEKPTTRDLAYLENRVRDLENWQTWAMRLGVPSLGVTGFISIVGVLQK